jgi:hypothetical protein
MGHLTKTFDYGDLPEAEVRAMERHAQAVTDLRDRYNRQTVEAIAEIGKVLDEAQERLAKRKTGTFAAWVKKRCNISRSTAYRYIESWRLVRNCPTVGQYLDLSAVYLIAPESCPAKARAEVLKLAESGKAVTKEQAKAIVEKHTPPKPVPTAEPDEDGDDDPSGGAIVETTATTLSERKAPLKIGDEPTVSDVLDRINDAGTAIESYAATDTGREVDVPKASSLVKQLKAVVAGGSRSHVIASDVTMPPNLDSPECRKALDEWLIYKRSRNNAYKDAKGVEKLLRQWTEAKPAEFIAAVEYSQGQRYQALVPEKPSGNGFAKAPRRIGPGERFDPAAELGSL